MGKSNLIKDTATRDAVRELEKMKENIDRISPLPEDATLAQVIATVNKITNNLKRRYT